MDFKIITDLISQVGFPIFVAIYLLIEGRSQSQKIVAALTHLEKAIILLSEKK